MNTKISLQLPHGIINGAYYPAISEDAPIAIITVGSNGFHTFGMFPYIQKILQENGISSIAYNFSHGGVEDGLDYFTRLDLYEKNCMRLETEDLYGIIKNTIHSHIIKPGQKLFLLGHSLGGIPTIFSARRLVAEDIKINGIIFLASVSTLNFYAKEIEQWEQTGVWYVTNKRTNQSLPRGPELLSEVKKADLEWSAKKAMATIHTNYLIIHGNQDESVGSDHSKNLHDWANSYDQSSQLIYIKNGTHTFNTKHPFDKPSEELNTALTEIITFIKCN